MDLISRSKSNHRHVRRRRRRRRRTAIDIIPPALFGVRAKLIAKKSKTKIISRGFEMPLSRRHEATLDQNRYVELFTTY
jgi:hypothetical protein